MNIKFVKQSNKIFKIDALDTGKTVSIAFRFYFYAIILSDIIKIEV